MDDKYTFGTEGPWITDEEIQRRAEYNAQQDKKIQQRKAEQAARAKRLARYRKIGRFIGGLIMAAVIVGTVVAAFFTFRGLVIWLHVPSYVVVPASLWALGYMANRAIWPPKRKDS